MTTIHLTSLGPSSPARTDSARIPVKRRGIPEPVSNHKPSCKVMDFTVQANDKVHHPTVEFPQGRKTNPLGCTSTRGHMQSRSYPCEESYECSLGPSLFPHHCILPLRNGWISLLDQAMSPCTPLVLTWMMWSRTSTASSNREVQPPTDAHRIQVLVHCGLHQALYDNIVQDSGFTKQRRFCKQLVLDLS